MALATLDEISGLTRIHNDSLIQVLTTSCEINGPKNVKTPLTPVFILYLKGLSEKFECIGNRYIRAVDSSEFADEKQSREKH
jgi:hypothetical protein